MVSGTLLHAFGRHYGAPTLFQVLFQAQGTVVAWTHRVAPPHLGSRKKRTQSEAYRRLSEKTEEKKTPVLRDVQTRQTHDSQSCKNKEVLKVLPSEGNRQVLESSKEEKSHLCR